MTITLQEWRDQAITEAEQARRKGELASAHQWNLIASAVNSLIELDRRIAAKKEAS